MNISRIMINNLFDGLLYQYLHKVHMELMLGRKISDDTWALFLRDRQDAFADEVSELAREYFTEWIADSDASKHLGGL